MNRAGRTSRAVAIALCAFAALLLTSCSEETRDAIRSSVSDAASSVSVSPPSLPSVSGAPEPTEEPTEATEEPAEATEEPTEATEEPAEATEEPTEEPTEATEEPDGSTAAAGSPETGTSSTWIWLLVAIAAIVFALILVRMASRRREARAWRSRALGASSQGLALHDRVAAELAMGTHAAMSSARWTDVESSIDRLATDVNQLAATAPAEGDRSAIRDVSASLDGLRSAVLLQRSAQTGDQPSRELATQTLRERIGDFNAALRTLQIKLGAQPGSATGPS